MLFEGLLEVLSFDTLGSNDLIDPAEHMEVIPLFPLPRPVWAVVRGPYFIALFVAPLHYENIFDPDVIHHSDHGPV